MTRHVLIESAELYSDGTEHNRKSTRYDLTDDELTLKLGWLMRTHTSCKQSFDCYRYTFRDHGIDSMGTEYGKITIVEIGGLES